MGQEKAPPSGRLEGLERLARLAPLKELVLTLALTLVLVVLVVLAAAALVLVQRGGR